MPILSCTNIKHRYGDDIILDGLSLSVEAGDRIGVVGRNGTGKSTMLKAMAGLLKPDEGTISVQRGIRVGYLHQDPKLDPEETLRDAAEGAFEQLHAFHRELHDVFELMATAKGDELDRLLNKQVQLEEAITAAGGYVIEHKIEETLHGLGFTDAQFGIKVRNLSGGQRGRLALAKLLLESPDVLLLDEPTNHLDIEGRLWLEHYLRDEFKGAVLLISHDRYLLDAVVNRIIETEQGRLIEYPGNYAKFRELRVQRRMVMLRAYESQQDKFKKEEAFIRKYKAGQRARQAKGRETRLDREKESNTLERPMELDNFDFELPKAPRSGDVVVSCRNITKTYPRDDGGTKTLFRDLTVSIQRGERWGIIGPNGAGKTSLVRAMLGELSIDEGVAKVGGNVIIGYYRQTHDGLDLSKTVWQYLQGIILRENAGIAFSEQQARDLGGAFLFSGDEQEKLLGVLSGGERSRAVLAGLLASGKNLLILDEPTNHLDISSAERLEEALSKENGFDGTMILISHDRALLDGTCDHLVVLDGTGGAEIILGNYSAWHERDTARKSAATQAENAAKEKREADERRKRENAAAQNAKPSTNRASENSHSKQKPGGPAADQLSKLARLKTEELEKRIEQVETKMRTIDASLEDPDVWRDHAKLERLHADRAKLAADLEPLEFEWARRAET